MLDVHGKKDSIRFGLEHMNELQVYWVGEQPKGTRGFHGISVTRLNIMKMVTVGRVFVL
jgi:hypothetical protein